jgi:hypothetical protein
VAILRVSVLLKKRFAHFSLSSCGRGSRHKDPSPIKGEGVFQHPVSVQIPVDLLRSDLQFGFNIQNKRDAAAFGVGRGVDSSAEERSRHPYEFRAFAE